MAENGLEWVDGHAEGFHHVPNTLVMAPSHGPLTHQGFSKAVAEVLPRIEAAQAQKGGGRHCTIAAICGYSPKFFYDEILQRIPEASRRTDIDPLEKDISNGNLHVRFTKDDALAFDIHGNQELAIKLQAAERAFQTAADKVFPHFKAIRRLHARARARGDRIAIRRFCLFAPRPGVLYNGSDDSYLNDYRDELIACKTLPFFLWLNGDVPCHVIPPRKWEAWGFRHGARDFAMVCRAGHQCAHILEYYSDFGFYLWGKGVDHNWPFVEIQTLVEAIHSPQRWNDLWATGRFYEKVTGYEEARTDILKVFQGIRACATQRRTGETNEDENQYCERIDIACDDIERLIPALPQYQLKRFADDAWYRGISQADPATLLVENYRRTVEDCERLLTKFKNPGSAQK